MKTKTLDCPPLSVRALDGTEMKVVNYPALLSFDADVYLIFGMRSFGKSYGLKQYVIDRWLETGETFVMMRTIEDDISQGKARRYIADIMPYFNEAVGYEKELTVYSSDFMARSIGEGKQIIREKIGSVMSLSGWLKYKGNSYENATTVIFEEFLERKPHLTSDAFIEGYLNNLSTIIRLRQNVKVFCLANTVRKKSPIFDYYHIDLRKIKKGQPTLFSEDNGLRVCVYWTPDVDVARASSKHYTVDDSRQAKMITSGAWEESDFPTTWGGLDAERLKLVKRFRNAPKVYIPEYDVTVYCLFDKSPFLFVKGKIPTRFPIVYSLYSVAIEMPTFYREMRNRVLSGRVVHDGKCADVMDYIKDNIL